MWIDNLVTFTAEKFNIEEFKSGRLHEKGAMATWRIRNIPGFA
jgi:hypothetical protein